MAPISADGRYVAFHSWATNLVAGGANALAALYIHDRQTGTTTRVATVGAGPNHETGFFAVMSASAQTRSSSCSHPGLWTGCRGARTGWRICFVLARASGTIERVSLSHDGEESDPNASAAGVEVSFLRPSGAPLVRTYTVAPSSALVLEAGAGSEV